jgi:hypothetical protein
MQRKQSAIKYKPACKSQEKRRPVGAPARNHGWSGGDDAGALRFTGVLQGCYRDRGVTVVLQG